jgi:hypothetical protein
MLLRLTNIASDHTETHEGDMTLEQFIEANGGDNAELLKENLGMTAHRLEDKLREIGVLRLDRCVGSALLVQVIG